MQLLWYSKDILVHLESMSHTNVEEVITTIIKVGLAVVCSSKWSKNSRRGEGKDSDFNHVGSLSNN